MAMAMAGYSDMPKVTIWIKDEDYQAWKAIPDRPKWLHQMLNPVVVE